MSNNRIKNKNKKSARRSRDYNVNRNYYYKKREMIPEEKCYVLVENEMILHRLLVNLPEPNDMSRGAFEHWYLLRKMADELTWCCETSEEEKEYYAKIYVWADLCYRMIYNDVKERNSGYKLPPFPEMTDVMREAFEMLNVPKGNG